MPTNYLFELKHVSKLYGGNIDDAIRLLKQGEDKANVFQKTGCTAAMWDVNLNIRQGEIFVIIGLSGSGKSTVLRCLNQLNIPSSGEILFHGRDICKMKKNELLALRRGKISMVFQTFGLMSHRDVLSNVAYPLEIRKVPKTERENKAAEIIQLVGLNGLEHKSCDSLSGGMRQRVGIARALCSDADVLLMDEPFSALDPLVRQDMQFELLKIQRKLGKTIVFITHDIDEAFKLGDTVAIMRDGKIIQVDTPVKMSANPANEYVRRFINSADRSKVLTAENIMVTPNSLIRTQDSPSYAVHEMGKQKISSAYVVDDALHLIGIVTITAAVKAHNENKTINDVIFKDVARIKKSDLVSDIIPVAAESPYPVAVVDVNGILEGIVTKASVLSSLS